MKRGELIKRVKKIAKSQGATVEFSEGGKHTHVKIGDRVTTVPRHSDVNELTAKAIIKYLEGK